ncbi:MAG: diaminopimelate decarboxylase [Alicyclobacillus herbarius]|uniref:diaminopimelate decarboxylase n=1 Tax=Alicyclobacillus herbarius TaxID=122960 RepID=UPI002356A73F|nr:diaminopimelate decarboxylase [Alicyclobacillus herbarius]MCL6632045.1 diaminopimelate decarboxylase [Alicyclobacillus herbarius]
MHLSGTMEIGGDGRLYIGGCDTTELAARFGTPLIVYDEALIRENIRRFHRAFERQGVQYTVAYAAKAFCTIAMCQLANEEDCALDVVSGGELYTALAAGVPAERIHMHGNNKTPTELAYALDSGIGVVVVDNFHELFLLDQLAREKGMTVRILLRISPGVEAHTHDYIMTGQQDSKFGFDLASGQAAEALQTASTLTGVECIGLHSHIGSQIFDSAGFVAAAERLASLYRNGLELGFPFSVLNLGGGFGIRYTEGDPVLDVERLIADMVQAVARQFEGVGMPEIWVEPGRSIVGAAGVTLYTVGSMKMIPGVRNYLAVDGGMTDNPRYALYGAEYQALLANRANEPVADVWTIAGKCCESGDLLTRDTPLPSPQSGDILAVLATGAYNYSMASHYNRLPKPAVVFVRDGEAQLVVERETWQDILRQDRPLRRAPQPVTAGVPHA